MDNITIGLAFIAGLLSFISPCVLPLVPAYIGYMGGRMTRTIALQTNAKEKVDQGNVVAQRANMLLHGIAFVLGFTLVFVALGLMTTAFVKVLGNTATLVTDIIARVGGAMIIFFGLHFMGAVRWFFAKVKANPIILSPATTILVGFVLSLLVIWGTIELVIALPLIAGIWLWLILGDGLTQSQTFWLGVINRIELSLYSDTRPEMNPNARAGLFGSFLMGVVFSAGWTPCIGPIYGSILMLAANTGEIGQATPLLIAYSLGLGIPFILAATLIGQVQSLLRRLKRHMHTIELVSGIFLVIVGFLVASGQLTRFSQVLSNDFADFSLRVEECGVGFFEGDLGFNQIGSCFNGTLVPIALNQTATSKLTSDTPIQEFVVHLEEAQSVDVEFSKIDPAFTPTVTVYGTNGDVLATSTTLTPIADEKFVAISNLSIPNGGLVRIVIENTAGSFKVKMRKTSELTSTTPTDTATTQTSTPTASTDEGNSAVIGLVETGLITDLAAQTDPVEGLDEGDLAPDFTVTTLDGQTLTLSDLRGQVVLLNFWGTWCAPCRREIPDLQALYSQYGDLGFTMVGLAVRDTVEKVTAFQQEFGVTFPLALDTDNLVTTLYAIQGQPSTIIINRDGTILAKYFSIISQDDITPIIKQALSR